MRIILARPVGPSAPRTQWRCPWVSLRCVPTYFPELEIAPVAVYDFHDRRSSSFSLAGIMPALATGAAILARDLKAGAFRGYRLLRATLFVTALLTTVRSLHALDPEILISQFTHTAWSAQDGIPVPVRAIAQTRDGYLWLGTEAGLYRFDGLQFLPWEPTFGEHLVSHSVLALYMARDGHLWIGYGAGGVGLLAGERLQIFVAGQGVPAGGILSIVEDRDGSIWVCGQYGLSKYANGVWHPVGEDMGYPAPAAQSLLLDRKGNLWVATDGMDFGLSSDPVRKNTILPLPQAPHALPRQGSIPRPPPAPSATEC